MQSAVSAAADVQTFLESQNPPGLYTCHCEQNELDKWLQKCAFGDHLPLVLVCLFKTVMYSKLSERYFFPST